MQGDGIPDDVKQFIYRYINSVMQLEVLLFLFNHSSQSWSVTALVREFRLDPSWIENELEDLCTEGLLKTTTSPERTYRLEPSSPSQERAIQGLVRAYADRRVTVTSLIYSKPVDNIRVFADAFKLRKG
jgi:DNA-binding MarR family transcriptional regulator